MKLPLAPVGKLKYLSLSALIIVLILSKITCRDNGKKDPIIGIKLYQSIQLNDSLYWQWEELGINTVFISHTSITDKELIPDLRRHGMRIFIIVPIYFDAELLAQDPSYYSIRGNDRRAWEDWVAFVSPFHEGYRRQKIKLIRDLVRQYQPDGISLDFLRFFVFWERIRPGDTLKIEEYSCFTPSAIENFESWLGQKIPIPPDSIRQLSAYIALNHSQAWQDWKCHTIAVMTEQIVDAAKKVKTDLLINYHIIPWRRDEYNSAIMAIAGQDIRQISPFVDFFSPMCYVDILERSPLWIDSLLEDMAQNTSKPIIPNIEALDDSRFDETLRRSLASPSSSVILWYWEKLIQSSNAQSTLKKYRNLIRK